MTVRLLDILDALTDMRVGKKRSDEWARGWDADDSNALPLNRLSDSHKHTQAGYLSADRRLSVEVAATLRLFISEFPHVRSSFSFHSDYIAPTQECTAVNAQSNGWDRDTDHKRGSGSVRHKGSKGRSGISSRILLLQVLRPAAVTAAADSNTSPSSSSQHSLSHSSSSSLEYQSHRTVRTLRIVLHIWRTP